MEDPLGKSPPWSFSSVRPSPPRPPSSQDPPAQFGPPARELFLPISHPPFRLTDVSDCRPFDAVSPPLSASPALILSPSLLSGGLPWALQCLVAKHASVQLSRPQAASQVPPTGTGPGFLTHQFLPTYGFDIPSYGPRGETGSAGVRGHSAPEDSSGGLAYSPFLVQNEARAFSASWPRSSASADFLPSGTFLGEEARTGDADSGLCSSGQSRPNRPGFEATDIVAGREGREFRAHADPSVSHQVAVGVSSVTIPANALRTGPIRGPHLSFSPRSQGYPVYPQTCFPAGLPPSQVPNGLSCSGSLSPLPPQPGWPLPAALPPPAVYPPELRAPALAVSSAVFTPGDGGLESGREMVLCRRGTVRPRVRIDDSQTVGPLPSPEDGSDRGRRSDTSHFSEQNASGDLGTGALPPAAREPRQASTITPSAPSASLACSPAGVQDLSAFPGSASGRPFYLQESRRDSWSAFQPPSVGLSYTSPSLGPGLCPGALAVQTRGAGDLFHDNPQRRERLLERSGGRRGWALSSESRRPDFEAPWPPHIASSLPQSDAFLARVEGGNPGGSEVALLPNRNFSATSLTQSCSTPGPLEGNAAPWRSNAQPAMSEGPVGGAGNDERERREHGGRQRVADVLESSSGSSGHESARTESLMGSVATAPNGPSLRYPQAARLPRGAETIVPSRSSRPLSGQGSLGLASGSHGSPLTPPLGSVRSQTGVEEGRPPEEICSVPPDREDAREATQKAETELTSASRGNSESSSGGPPFAPGPARCPPAPSGFPSSAPFGDQERVAGDGHTASGGWRVETGQSVGELAPSTERTRQPSEPAHAALDFSSHRRVSSADVSSGSFSGGGSLVTADVMQVPPCSSEAATRPMSGVQEVWRAEGAAPFSCFLSGSTWEQGRPPVYEPVGSEARATASAGGLPSQVTSERAERPTASSTSIRHSRTCFPEGRVAPQSSPSPQQAPASLSMPSSVPAYGQRSSHHGEASAMFLPPSTSTAPSLSRSFDSGTGAALLSRARPPFPGPVYVSRDPSWGAGNAPPYASLPSHPFLPPPGPFVMGFSGPPQYWQEDPWLPQSGAGGWGPRAGPGPQSRTDPHLSGDFAFPGVAEYVYLAEGGARFRGDLARDRDMGLHSGPPLPSGPPAMTCRPPGAGGAWNPNETLAQRAGGFDAFQERVFHTGLGPLPSLDGISLIRPDVLPSRFPPFTRPIAGLCGDESDTEFLSPGPGRGRAGGTVSFGHQVPGPESVPFDGSASCGGSDGHSAGRVDPGTRRDTPAGDGTRGSQEEPEEGLSGSRRASASLSPRGGLRPRLEASLGLAGDRSPTPRPVSRPGSEAPRRGQFAGVGPSAWGVEGGSEALGRSDPDAPFRRLRSPDQLDPESEEHAVYESEESGENGLDEEGEDSASGASAASAPAWCLRWNGEGAQDVVELYEVERIIGVRRLVDGSKRYKVRWKDYLPADDTWEPQEHLEGLEELLEEAEEVLGSEEFHRWGHPREPLDGTQGLTRDRRPDRRSDPREGRACTTQEEEGEAANLEPELAQRTGTGDEEARDACGEGDAPECVSTLKEATVGEGDALEQDTTGNDPEEAEGAEVEKDQEVESHRGGEYAFVASCLAEAADNPLWRRYLQTSESSGEPSDASGTQWRTPQRPARSLCTSPHRAPPNSASTADLSRRSDPSRAMSPSPHLASTSSCSSGSASPRSEESPTTRSPSVCSSSSSRSRSPSPHLGRPPPRAVHRVVQYRSYYGEGEFRLLWRGSSADAVEWAPEWLLLQLPEALSPEVRMQMARVKERWRARQAAMNGRALVSSWCGSV
ncbi:chrromatin organization modifier domain-containing protein [Toxoplasma gondii TgCatPRC2]|uniref:Chrromatin organization modifier domain-containing protein n=1 Tax=Toxoplasma gondii TgCatPRC2 TaxID=1130821 RepID=A0A151HNH5_TOXGO|nr:chrromatin organization modifier domain-containing protein [Toxoplasma gondii TgCatPRC2]